MRDVAKKNWNDTFFCDPKFLQSGTIIHLGAYLHLLSIYWASEREQGNFKVLYIGKKNG